MDDVDQDLEVEEGDQEADFEVFGTQSRQRDKKRKALYMQQPQIAIRTAPTAFGSREERREESDEDMGFGLFDGTLQPSLTPYKPKNLMDAKQRLLHLLPNETLVKTRLHGEITAFRSQYDAWYPYLPHSTIRSVLAFLGVSGKWLNFFHTLLQAPLKFQDEEEASRTRKRGTPGSHILGDFFQRDGPLLPRLYC